MPRVPSWVKTEEDHRVWVEQLRQRRGAALDASSADAGSVAVVGVGPAGGAGGEGEGEESVREPDMQADIPERPKPAKKAGKAKRKDDTELKEDDLRSYLSMFCQWAASHPGREYWQRNEDELVLVTVPATRIYNRLDEDLRKKLQTLSDPAALIFGVAMVFGPAITQEVIRARGYRRPQPAPRPDRPAVVSNGTGTPAYHPSVGADPAARPADIPPLGL